MFNNSFSGKMYVYIYYVYKLIVNITDTKDV